MYCIASTRPPESSRAPTPPRRSGRASASTSATRSMCCTPGPRRWYSCGVSGGPRPGGRSLAGELVKPLRVQPEHLAPRLLRQRRQPLAKLAHDAERGVDVRVVRGPEEVVAAEVLDHLGRDRLVGVRRDQALAAEVFAWRHLDRRLVGQDAVLVVEAVEPGSDPVGARLENDAA